MNQNDMKYFAIIILLGLNLLTTLFLQSFLPTGYVLPLVLILIGTILMAGTIFGLWIEEQWAYSLATIIFAASLIHIAWLFYNAQAFLTFAFGLLVNIAGLVLCLVNSSPDEWQELETYEIEQAAKKRKK